VKKAKQIIRKEKKRKTNQVREIVSARTGEGKD